jgi:hypothetical protein
MTREQVLLFITKTPAHYWDLNPGPLVSQSGPQTTRPVDRQNANIYIHVNAFSLHETT